MEFTADNLNQRTENAKARFGFEELAKGNGGGLSIDAGGPSLAPSRRATLNDFVTVYVDTVSSTDNYEAFLDIGGNYFIQHASLSSSGNIQSFTFYLGSGGSGKLATDWGNRATLTYVALDKLGLS